jgi:hypothetical protein
MATTFRQLLNRVLRNVGEPEIAPTTTELLTDYTKLLANFFNTIKEEVEDSHNWRALRTTNTVIVLAGTDSVDITWANERSRVVRIQDEHLGGELPLVFDVTDPSSARTLRELDIAAYVYLRTVDPAASSANSPTYFAIDNSSGDVSRLLVWPPPITPRTIQLTMCVPSGRYEDDELDTVIAIPTAPIEMGVTWYAMEERGEELGINALFSEQRYTSMLNAHISRDLAEQGEAQLVVS